MFFELFPRFVSEPAESPLSRTIRIQFCQTILPAQSLNSQISPSGGMTIFPCSVLLSTQSGGSAMDAAPFWLGASRLCQPYRKKHFPSVASSGGSKGGAILRPDRKPGGGWLFCANSSSLFHGHESSWRSWHLSTFEARSRLSEAERNQATKRAGNAGVWQSLVLYPGKAVHVFNGKIGEAFNNLNLEVWKTVHDLPFAGIVRKRSH